MEHYTIDDVREVLKFHEQVPGDTPEFTTNRLWRKHFKKRIKEYGLEFVRAAPRFLTKENTSVTLEEWPTDRLSKLFPEDTDRLLVGREDDPVVVVEFRNRDCLIDGGRRITKWRKEKDPHSHATFVLLVSEDAD